MKLERHSIDEALEQAKLDQGFENINEVFRPIPGSSQEIALDARCNEIMYCGARGPGKTITQLMKFRRYVGLGYGKYWRGVIFDREFKNLADLVAQSLRFFYAFEDGAKFLLSATEYKWVWPTGEELLFRHVKRDTDYEGFHGHEYPFIGWNELTKFPTPTLYEKMLSTNRSSFDPVLHTPKLIDRDGLEITDSEGNTLYDTPDYKPLPPIPLVVFSTSNPAGPGHNWVKKKFINPAKYGEVVETKTKIYDPKTKGMVEVIRTQIALFGSFIENTFLPAEYIANLYNIKDPNLRKAWLEGSWDVTAGGMFDDLWHSDTHVIDRFPIPDNWYVDRSFDWGSSTPYACGWWAEANGEEVELPDGSIWCPPAGTLIQIAELYGVEDISMIGRNQGNKRGSKDVAKDIVKKEKKLLDGKWIASKPKPGPADNQIHNETDKENNSIATNMEAEKVKWTTSDKSKGSRANGAQLMRDRLEASITGDGPGIYFMRNCQASIETIPPLPRDKDDLDVVDKDSEDHCFDMSKYRILRNKRQMTTELNLNFPT